MKRRRLLQHLQAHGCRLVREGGRHSWWENPNLNKRSAIPRHSQIDDPPEGLRTLGVIIDGRFLGPNCKAAE